MKINQLMYEPLSLGSFDHFMVPSSILVSYPFILENFIMCSISLEVILENTLRPKIRYDGSRKGICCTQAVRSQ